MNASIPPGDGIRRSVTFADTPAQAVEHLHRDLAQDDTALVVVFCSPKLLTTEMAASLSRRFGQVPVVGCSTAGEIGPAGYQHGSVVGVSFAKPDFQAVARGIPDIREFSVGAGRDLVQGLLRDMDRLVPGGPVENIFAMLLCDGISACEESLVSALHRELGPIPLFGGSAGDELAFHQTVTMWDGAIHPHGAVLVLIATDRPFTVFKTEHFVSKQEKMVVTEADPANRIVTEINAEPAAHEYARVVGLDVDELTPMVFANYPVVVRVNGVPYVRSIQKVNPDESLTFFCAIDEGIVLTVAEGQDIVEDMKSLFQRVRDHVGEPEVVIGCDCILRNLELRQKQQMEPASALMAANNVVGFNTYGEQFHAMHVNQTFTGVAIGKRR